MADINNVVTITDTLAPEPTTGRDFGRVLFLNSAGALASPTTEAEATQAVRDIALRRYSSLAAVDEDWDDGDVPYDAAQIYFTQRPYPADLLIGNHIAAARAGVVYGRQVTPNPAPTSGDTYTFTFLSKTLTTVALGSTPTPSNVAMALQTAIRTDSDFGNTTVTATGTFTSGFTLVVSIPADRAGNANLNFDGPAFSGADAVTLGLADSSTSSDVIYAPPIAIAANLTATLDRLAAEPLGFYWVVLASALATQANIVNAAAWVEANDHMLGFDTNTAGVAATAADTLTTTLLDADEERVFGIYSGTQDYKALSLAARFSSVDYDVPGSIITGNLRTLPNTAPDALSDTQIAALTAKRTNYYVTIGGSNVLRMGWTYETWIDSRAFVDWFSDSVQTAIFDLLRTGSAVPYTDRGIDVVRDAIIGVCETAVNNGGISPGTVTDSLARQIRDVTGNGAFDGNLTSGYLVHMPTAASVTADDRAARLLNGVRIFATGSGAIHNVNIDLTFRP